MTMANVNFVLSKVNDIDVCQLQQEQRTNILDILLNEETENIVLELKRKSWWNRKRNANVDEINKKMCFLKIHHNTSTSTSSCIENTTPALSSEITVNLRLPPAMKIEKFCVEKSTQTEDIAFYMHEHIQRNTDRLIDQEHNLFEQSLAPEIDMEEITLRKSDSNERLGITVCYSNNADIFGSNCATTVTEVYISDIHPDSVAGRDGRLRQGDQILQINGKHIKSQSETETLIAENNNAVTLLVSRYLYADEDDFNAPSTNEEDDEVLIVEEDEDDDDDDDDEDDDDDDEDEYYEENNMTYVNCVINNDCCINATDDLLDKALLSQVVQEKPFEQMNIKHEVKYTSYQNNTAKSTSDPQKEKKSKIGRKTSSLKGERSINLISTKMDNITSPSDKVTKDEYEKEHIYETIPEDTEPESEPFYCSPYDSSIYVTTVASCTSSTIRDALQQLQKKQRVAQWLGIKPIHDICSTTAPRQSVRNGYSNARFFASGHRSVTSTVRSIATSIANGTTDWGVANNTLPGSFQKEDQDNSSSAYNTGDSNNSVSPLTLMFDPKNRCDQNVSMATSTINISANGTSDDELAIQQMYQKTNSPKECKITSPKISSTHALKTNIGAPAKKIIDVQMSSAVSKECNVHRNMLLKQHLFNQKLNLETTLQPYSFQQGRQSYYQQQHDQTHCPHFTAPNLSQYHFVSSQQVNNLSLTNQIPKTSTTVAATITGKKNEEESMVWKVKRRPDGTRYIVKRPAKNRIIKERSSRLNSERFRNDITTTEDDTISEIKTGRYWTREERKKHIEKAKERRQQQQFTHQNQNKTLISSEDSATITALCVGDANNSVFNDSNSQGKYINQQNIHLIKPSQKIANQQQHYQLQFNSPKSHKLSTMIKNKESPTKNLSQTFPINSEDLLSVKGNIDKIEIFNSMPFTLSEENQINNILQFTTTS